MKDTRGHLMGSARRFLKSLLALYFRIVPVPESFAEVARQRADTVIVTQSDSLIIGALLESFARRTKMISRYCDTPPSLDLPHASGGGALEEKELLWISIHDRAAMEALLSRARKVRFSTLNIFYGRGPLKSLPRYKPGFARLILTLVMARVLVILFGPPCGVDADLLDNLRKFQRHLRSDFYKNLKLVRGTPFQAIEVQARQVVAGVLSDPECAELGAQGIEPVEIAARSRKAFFEMAANPMRPMYIAGSLICRALINRLFTNVTTHGLDSFIPACREHTVVLVPMHRSHLDYILLGYKLYESNLNPPVVAAGVNLSFWPFGWIIRSLGGYFVKRNSRSDRIHALTLKHYVTYLVRRGHLQEFFIEGGRSRSGRMLPPKLGLLNTIIAAHEDGLRREILFVPVSITYEHVIEDRVYAEENTGRPKTPESLGALLKIRKVFRKVYGEVFLKFGEPISLSEYSNRFLARYQEGSGGGTVDEAAKRQALRTSFGHHLIRRIGDQTSITLTGLTHTALMMAPGYGLPWRALRETVQNLSEVVEIQRSDNPDIGSLSSSLELFRGGRHGLLFDLERSGSAQPVWHINEEVFYIAGPRRFTADFYRNGCIHLFFNLGLFSILELLDGRITSGAALPFARLFRHDRLLPEDREFEAELSRQLELYRKAGILEQTGDAYCFKNRAPGFFIPAMLQGMLQSLLWVMENLVNGLSMPGGPDRTEDGRTVIRSFNYKDFMAGLQSGFKTESYLARLDRTEAASLTNLQAAIDTLYALGIVTWTQISGQRQKLHLVGEHLEMYELLIKSNEAITGWQNRYARSNYEDSARTSTLTGPENGIPD
jgi:1-acyl-sn-glycerol-3-phosphate acyltransferase